MGMLRELADLTGLSTQVTAALADTYRGPWVYAPGEVFADLAAAVADGADCIDGVGQLCGDREHVFGAKASTTTMWRWSMNVSTPRTCLGCARPGPPRVRRRGPPGPPRPPGGWLHIDIDATLVIDHSDNKATPPRPGRSPSGHHPLLAFLDRPEIAGGEALGRAAAGRQRRPQHRRRPRHVSWRRRWRRCRRGSGPTPTIPASPILCGCWCARDTAGATHDFATPADRGGGVLLRVPRRLAGPATRWTPSTSARPGIRRSTPTAASATAPGSPRPPGWSSCHVAGRNPAGPAQRTPPPRRAVAVHRRRLACGSPRSSPTPPPVSWRASSAGLELRHRQHARVEDRIREAQSHRPAQPALPLVQANAAWLEIVLAAADLVTWAQLIGFTDHPAVARAEIDHLPLPGPARRRPHHPRRPTTAAAHRRHLAVGHRHLRRMATTTGRLHLTPSPPSTRPEERRYGGPHPPSVAL